MRRNAAEIELVFRSANTESIAQGLPEGSGTGCAPRAWRVFRFRRTAASRISRAPKWRPHDSSISSRGRAPQPSRSIRIHRSLAIQRHRPTKSSMRPSCLAPVCGPTVRGERDSCVSRRRSPPRGSQVTTTMDASNSGHGIARGGQRWAAPELPLGVDLRVQQPRGAPAIYSRSAL